MHVSRFSSSTGTTQWSRQQGSGLLWPPVFCMARVARTSVRRSKRPNRQGCPVRSFREGCPMGPKYANACHAGRPQAAILWVHLETSPPPETDDFAVEIEPRVDDTRHHRRAYRKGASSAHYHLADRPDREPSELQLRPCEGNAA